MSGDTRGAVDGWLAGGFLRSCGGSGSVQNAESTPAVTTATMTRVEASLVQKRATPSARLGRPICVILRQVAGHAGGGGLGFGAGSPLDGTADRVRHPLSEFPRL